MKNNDTHGGGAAREIERSVRDIMERVCLSDRAHYSFVADFLDSSSRAGRLAEARDLLRFALELAGAELRW